MEDAKGHKAGTGIANGHGRRRLKLDLRTTSRQHPLSFLPTLSVCTKTNDVPPISQDTASLCGKRPEPCGNSIQSTFVTTPYYIVTQRFGTLPSYPGEVKPQPRV